MTFLAPQLPSSASPSYKLSAFCNYAHLDVVFVCALCARLFKGRPRNVIEIWPGREWRGRRRELKMEMEMVLSKACVAFYVDATLMALQGLLMSSNRSCTLLLCHWALIDRSIVLAIHYWFRFDWEEVEKPKNELHNLFPRTTRITHLHTTSAYVQLFPIVSVDQHTMSISPQPRPPSPPSPAAFFRIHNTENTFKFYQFVRVPFLTSWLYFFLLRRLLCPPRIPTAIVLT